MSARGFRRLAAPLVAVGLAIAGGGLAAAASPGQGWRIVTTFGSARVGELPGFLTVTSPQDAFSSWRCADCARSVRGRNFVEHWNGRAWRKIALPAPLNYPRFLIALGASDASNLWALTTTGKAGIWNGKKWAVRSLPSWVLRPTRVGEPSADISVSGRGDVWIFSLGATTQPTLAAHFDKGAWHKVRLPAVPVEVAPVSSGDIWAVGITPKSLTSGHPVWTAMHWDGSAWRDLALPRVTLKAGGSVSYTITASGPRAVWVVRSLFPPSHPERISLLHWTGRWQQIAAPSTAVNFGVLAPDGHGGVWISAARAGQPMAVAAFFHYGAGKWTTRDVPSKPGFTNDLAGLAQIPGTRSMWATGLLLGTHDVQLGDILKFGR